MTLPSADTPLYNHPLPELEQWLRDQGCQQDNNDLNYWYIKQPTWEAELCLEIEELTVRYINAAEGNSDINRSFKYSLSREDVEAAVFSGP
ncbi:MAG: DUF3143 domain-containing protein [Cyanobacteria bacterium QH_8_48_120]|jgi:hypothetical protein|nr:MAG: DUF3143 domain-containing protein [Cyanobacteria bacterium QH_1_48_107]PSO54335.1 MAG: DUF3143 domain-containing protein [Cyanobacteria bacterium QH_10_48_56]PSO58456.1 MAG: DUF3143 domain-containing protein [Cyanobacteria bacterium QH_7_48_89]PSO63410.1 MAG: DUF3143 domain-containing protein [Cyanobacteria bacterium QH_6_48_35]PSO67160.1 MAG: DUF3143 domain-containing protein [Cyanobacteria bacterium QS_1_48_34]PSO76385.1 MAG: DUF3143 domain-containing protein [Cyanobacteria bacterium